jgi:hypothetical protein
MSESVTQDIPAPIVKHRATAQPVAMPAASKAIINEGNAELSAELSAANKAANAPAAVKASRAETRTLVNDAGVAMKPAVTREANKDTSPAAETAKDPQVEATPAAKTEDKVAKVEDKATDDKETVSQEKLGKRFAALAKQDKELRAREAELKRFETVVREMSEAKTNAKKDPKKFLQAYGITLDDIINAELQITKQPTQEEKIQALVEEKIKPYKEEIEKDKERVRQENTNKDVSNFKSTVLSPFLEKYSSDYDMMITEYGETAQEKLYETLTERLKIKPRQFQTPEETMAFIKETADALEDELVQVENKRLERLQNSKKFSGRLANRQTETDTDSPVTSGSRTLTNNLSAIATAPTSTKRLSRHESIKAAAKRLQQELDRNKK